MKRSHLVVLATAVTLFGGAAVVRLAGAQPAPDPAPTGMVCGGQPAAASTAEPPTGFVGACLGGAMTYQPSLPTVCYAPAAIGGDAGGITATTATTCTIAASKVGLSYSVLPASYDSYRVLMTCYPHANGSCPSGSFAVSRSCCDLGTNMVSLDGVTASGIANL